MLKPGNPGRNGYLIVFEGIDGCGKSTQARMLEEYLTENNLKTIRSFEPTDGEFGQKLREIWKKGVRHDPAEELELFRLDRNDHVNRLILPGLKNGTVVILDRYYYSSEAYQGVRGDFNPKYVHDVMATFAPQPDLTLVFNMDIEDALNRIISSRNETPNVMEKRENLRKVQQAFSKMTYPEICQIDASGSIEEVFSRVLQPVKKLLSV